jgi:hypothetical protein
MRIVFMMMFFVLGLVACKNKNTMPNGILNKEQMQAVLWDIMRAETFTSTFIKKDTLKNAFYENAKLQKEIFALHNTSKEEFYKSYGYYKEHPSAFEPILDSMITKTSRTREMKAREKIHPLFTKKSFTDKNHE